MTVNSDTTLLRAEFCVSHHVTTKKVKGKVTPLQALLWPRAG